MPTYGDTTSIIIAQPGKINVQHWRGIASFQNGLRIISPIYQDLTPTSNPYPGNTYTSTAVYPAGTEIILQLYNIPYSYITEDSNTSAAQFQDGYQPGYTWQINWEDAIAYGTSDYDYNDSFTYIYTTGVGNLNLSRIRYRAYNNDGI